VDTWTLLHTFADDATYASTATKWQEYLDGHANGTPPFTLAISWEEQTLFTGLLDTYSGATAAYSLRLLDKDYAGSAIRVRRASDNTEQDIGFTLAGGLDTSALTTFCTGTDGFIRTWYNQAGATNLVQTTSANQFKIYDSSTGVLVDSNGKPRGVPQNESADLNTGPLLSGRTFVFATAQTNVIGAVDFQVLLHGGTSGAQFVLVANVSSPAGGTSGSVTNESYYIDGSAYTPTTRGQLWTDLSGANHLVTIDANFTSWGALRYGYSSSSIGAYPVQELVIYASDQSANRSGIESNISTYYGI
jgi:hypothetical protein